jgi:hypothetical protein
VPGAGDEALEEHGAAAERAQCLRPGALERLGEVGGGSDDADSPPAAAGGGLEHERVADALRRRERVIEGRDGAPAPRRDGDADLLGDQLRADLVAQLAHRVRVRPDEGDADLLAQLGEHGVLGDEAPADPRGVGPGLEQGPFEHRVVEVRPGRRGPEGVGQVGLPDERGGAVRVGVEGDRLDPGTCLRGQVPDGVDQPHRGLPAVDDGDSTEHRYRPPKYEHAEGDAPSPVRALGAPPSPASILLDGTRGTKGGHDADLGRQVCGKPTKRPRRRLSRPPGRVESRTFTQSPLVIFRHSLRTAHS